MPSPTPNPVFEEVASGRTSVFDACHSLDRESGMDEAARKGGGVVYTPESIALGMCRLASPSLSDTVLEPSCGRGVFVFALAEFHLASGSDPLAVNSGLSKNLTACDTDGKAVADLLLLWEAYWRNKGLPSPAPLSAVTGDTLFGPVSGRTFDLAIGNPPYVRFQNLPDDYREKLQGKFATCRRGNVDLCFAFVEHSLSMCSRHCLIYPRSWMSNASGRAMRELLAPSLLNIADYGGSLPFAPVRAYVCVTLASKRPRAPGTLAKLMEGGLHPGGVWSDIDPSSLSTSGWAPRPVLKKSPGAAKGAQGTKASLALGDIATLFSGVATLADSTYVFKGSRVENGHAVFTDPETGGETSVPLAISPLFSKITKVSSQKDLASSESRMLCPYRPDGSLIPFRELEESAPGAASFLLARRERLALRDRGKQESYPEWHAYGRKQGLKPLPQGPLCAVPTMGEGDIPCFEFDPAVTGRFLFTSGFILSPKPGFSTADISRAVTHPDSWKWMMAHGRPWAGGEGKNYRSFGARLLLSMPVPK